MYERDSETHTHGGAYVHISQWWWWTCCTGNRCCLLNNESLYVCIHGLHLKIYIFFLQTVMSRINILWWNRELWHVSEKEGYRSADMATLWSQQARQRRHCGQYIREANMTLVLCETSVAVLKRVWDSDVMRRYIDVEGGGKVRGASLRGGKMRGTVRGTNARRWVLCEAGMCEAQRTTGAAGVIVGCEPLKRN